MGLWCFPSGSQHVVAESAAAENAWSGDDDGGGSGDDKKGSTEGKKRRRKGMVCLVWVITGSQAPREEESRFLSPPEWTSEKVNHVTTSQCPCQQHMSAP